MRINGLGAGDVPLFRQDGLGGIAADWRKPEAGDRKAALDAFFERGSRMRVLDSRPADEGWGS